jgi:hypothetical protein
LPTDKTTFRDRVPLRGPRQQGPYRKPSSVAVTSLIQTTWTSRSFPRTITPHGIDRGRMDAPDWETVQTSRRDHGHQARHARLVRSGN